jgi:simple sugar transport system ATP-binding protein
VTTRQGRDSREGRVPVAPPLLRAVEIHKAYAGAQALSGVTVEVQAGEVVALAGENGSGKSTLIKIIAGVETADAGNLFIDGVDWTKRSPVERIAAGVQIIYQDFALFPNLSAGENIWLPYQMHRGRRLVSRSDGRAMAKNALDEIGVAFDLDLPVSQLSVSQKQLVAIARALIHDARLLIMDEPTTALTHREVQHLFAVIRRLAGQGMSFVFVSHKLQEVAEICQRVIVLRNGRKMLDRPMAGIREAEIGRAMTGRDIGTERYPRSPRLPDAAPRLAVRQLSHAREYRNVSFTLGAGEVLGLAGLLGSGRTAVVKGIFGLPPPDSGSIEIDGQPLVLRSVADAIAANIAYVPEDRLTEGLFLDFSISDNVVVRSLDHLMSPAGWITASRKRKEAKQWIERLAIKTPSPDLPVSSLSGGNQQRVVLAKWIAGHPRVLILNRPTVGVDVGSKSGIHDIVMELAADGVSIIVVSDDLPELIRVCDRVLVMRNGAVVAERRVEASSETEIMRIVSESAS